MAEEDDDDGWGGEAEVVVKWYHQVAAAYDAPDSHSNRLVELLADHCDRWRERCRMQYVDGYYTSESAISWGLCAVAYTGVPDYPMSLDDFPMIVLPECFLHAAKQSGVATAQVDADLSHLVNEEGIVVQEESERITNMGLQELMSTIHGIEWIVFCDMFREERRAEWWWEVLFVFELCVRRAFYLSTRTFDKNLLDMETYREVWTAHDEVPGENGGGGGGRDGGGSKAYKSSSEDESAGGEEEEEEEDDEMMDVIPGESEQSAEARMLVRQFSRRVSRPGRVVVRPRPGSDTRESKRQRRKIEAASKARAVPAARTGGGSVLPVGRPKFVLTSAEERLVEEELERRDRALASYVPPKKECADLTMDWVFDMDAITSHFWLWACKHETEPRPRRAPAVEIDKLRKFLFQTAQDMEDSLVVNARRFWYEDRIVTPAQRRIFRRDSPLDPAPKSRAILVTACEPMYKKPLETKVQVLDPEANSAMLRISTDAMFCLVSKALDTGDICRVLEHVYADPQNHRIIEYQSPEPVTAFPAIDRDPIRNLWVVHFSRTEKYSAPSFTSAFVFMRIHMTRMGLPPKKGDVDLSVWDEYVNLDQ